MQPLNFQTQDEFINAFLELVELNKDVYTPEEILAGMRDRGVFIGGKDIKKYNMSPENDAKIQSIVDGTYSEEGEDELVPGEYGYEEQEQKKEEAAPKTIYNSRNYDALKDFVQRYNQLVEKKENLLSKWNNGKGYNEKTGVIDEFKKELEEINTDLNSMEDGDEFKELLQSIKDYGMGTKFFEDDSYIRFGIDNIINKRGSAIEKNNIFKKFFLGSNMTSNTYKNIDDLIDGFLGDDKGSNNKKNSKTEDVKNDTKNNEVKENKGTEKIAGPQKYNTIKDNKVTDDMSFGADVSGAGGNDYLEERNKTLAMHLAVKGITTPEEIDKYLEKYPSWKNAKDEWKENTKNILSEKISNLGYKGKKEKGDDVSKEEVNDIIEENKEVEGGKGGKNNKTLKDNINKGVDKFRDVLENPNEYIKKGADWLSKLQPNDESPLNGTEEDEINIAEPMFDKNGKIVGTQRSEAYIYDKNGKPIGSKKSDKYLYDKNGRPIGSKRTPSNDDSINGVEEDEVTIEPIMDNKGNVVGLQRSDAYLYDKNGKPNGSKKSDKYIYDKSGKPVGSKQTKKETKKDDSLIYDKNGNPVGSRASNNAKKETKKETKKENKKPTMKDVINVIKSSPTIKNLLKNKK